MIVCGFVNINAANSLFNHTKLTHNHKTNGNNNKPTTPPQNKQQPHINYIIK